MPHIFLSGWHFTWLSHDFGPQISFELGLNRACGPAGKTIFLSVHFHAARLKHFKLNIYKGIYSIYTYNRWLHDCLTKCRLHIFCCRLLSQQIMQSYKTTEKIPQKKMSKCWQRAAVVVHFGGRRARAVPVLFSSENEQRQRQRLESCNQGLAAKKRVAWVSCCRGCSGAGGRAWALGLGCAFTGWFPSFVAATATAATGTGTVTVAATAAADAAAVVINSEQHYHCSCKCCNTLYSFTTCRVAAHTKSLLRYLNYNAI